MRVVSLVLVLALTVVVGAMQPAGADTLGDSPAGAVVAFVDGGINPYHETFRDTSPRAYEHPATYIPGFPADAIALRLTLDEPDYHKAVAADCETWRTVEPEQLYWVPGTKIVGAISFFQPPQFLGDTVPGGQGPGFTCGPELINGMPILDTAGHGTMVASRGASNDYGACKSCRIVVVQAPDTIRTDQPAKAEELALQAIGWAADNAGWIDAQSNSWGPFLSAYDPTGATSLFTSSPTFVRGVEAAASRQLFVMASGNGAGNRAGVVGHPTLLAPHLTPSVITAGAHDSGQVTAWHGFPPHLVSDACGGLMALHTSVSESGPRATGTSSATPFVAGGATQILLDARTLLGDVDTGVEDGVVARGPAGLVPAGPIADGVLTTQEWRRLVFTTATARPTGQVEDDRSCSTGLYGPTPLTWSEVPEGYPEYLHIGYGAVDRPAIALAGDVLRGTRPLPDRAATDAYFAADAAARGAVHTVLTTPPGKGLPGPAVRSELR